MKIIEGTTVDLIEPFPTNQLDRLWRWTKMVKLMTALDGSPQNEEDFVKFMEAALPLCRSFGVIDKDGALGFHHEAPIIGFIMFEPMPPCSMYAHIASSRRAWGTDLMKEASELAIKELFATEPGALRISAVIPAFNKRALAFARKVGLHKDGFFQNAATIKGKPISLVHFGIIRDNRRKENGKRTVGDSQTTSG